MVQTMLLCFMILAAANLCQGQRGDAPRSKYDESKLLVRDEYPRHQQQVAYDQTARDALKERLLRDYRIKLINKQHDERIDDYADEIYRNNGFLRNDGRPQKQARQVARLAGDQRKLSPDDQQKQTAPTKSDQQKQQKEEQQKSLDQTKEDLKRSLLKDFYKELMTEKHEQQKKDELSKKESTSENDFDDEILRHLVELKLKKEDPRPSLRRRRRRS